MEVENAHKGEMIGDFLTALKQEMVQSDAWVQAELFRFSSIDKTCENEHKRYIVISSFDSEVQTIPQQFSCLVEGL